MPMHADKAEVSWDTSKSKWLVRIQSGDEVMRRHCDVPKSATDQQLRAAAEKTVRDDGYDIDPSAITVRLV
ncbi:MAG TPA: hypothetical protein VMP12_11905 [Candidatus Sulfotelmatobacter sp.]|nr:hypothetical protein [Candidatus Sulfotelmatobacter sp.]